jgi:sugar lactone lactonase YvrE
VAVALAAAAAAAAMGTGGTAHAATLELSGPSRVLFVTNEVANSVTEYRTNADGDISPIATIAGANTRLSDPVGIAVDAAGHLWVTNFGTDSVTEYGRHAAPLAAWISNRAGRSCGLRVRPTLEG